MKDFKTYEQVAVEAVPNGYPFEFEITVGEQTVALVRVRANSAMEAAAVVSNSLRIEPAEKVIPLINLNQPR